MKKYRATASYKRIHPITLEAEETSRFHEGFYDNRGACEAELIKQIRAYDEVVGKISMSTRRVK